MEADYRRKVLKINIIKYINNKKLKYYAYNFTIGKKRQKGDC